MLQAASRLPKDPMAGVPQTGIADAPPLEADAPEFDPQKEIPREVRGILHGDPSEVRTRVTGVRGRCPRPLDDGAFERSAL